MPCELVWVLYLQYIFAGFQLLTNVVMDKDETFCELVGERRATPMH